jgi:hypothetical protein
MAGHGKANVPAVLAHILHLDARLDKNTVGLLIMPTITSAVMFRVFLQSHYPNVISYHVGHEQDTVAVPSGTTLLICCVETLTSPSKMALIQSCHIYVVIFDEFQYLVMAANFRQAHKDFMSKIFRPAFSDDVPLVLLSASVPAHVLDGVLEHANISPSTVVRYGYAQQHHITPRRYMVMSTTEESSAREELHRFLLAFADRLVHLNLGEKVIIFCASNDTVMSEAGALRHALSKAFPSQSFRVDAVHASVGQALVDVVAGRGGPFIFSSCVLGESATISGVSVVICYNYLPAPSTIEQHAGRVRNVGTSLVPTLCFIGDFARLTDRIRRSVGACKDSMRTGGSFNLDAMVNHFTAAGSINFIREALCGCVSAAYHRMQGVHVLLPAACVGCTGCNTRLFAETCTKSATMTTDEFDSYFTGYMPPISNAVGDARPDVGRLRSLEKSCGVPDDALSSDDCNTLCRVSPCVVNHCDFATASEEIMRDHLSDEHGDVVMVSSSVVSPVTIRPQTNHHQMRTSPLARGNLLSRSVVSPLGRGFAAIPVSAPVFSATAPKQPVVSIPPLQQLLPAGCIAAVSKTVDLIRSMLEECPVHVGKERFRATCKLLRCDLLPYVSGHTYRDAHVDCPRCLRPLSEHAGKVQCARPVQGKGTLYC